MKAIVVWEQLRSICFVAHKQDESMKRQVCYTLKSCVLCILRQHFPDRFDQIENDSFHCQALGGCRFQGAQTAMHLAGIAYFFSIIQQVTPNKPSSLPHSS